MTQVADKQDELSVLGKMNDPILCSPSASPAKSKGYGNPATSETDVQQLVKHLKRELDLSAKPKVEVLFDEMQLVKTIQHDIDAMQLFGDTPLYSDEVELRTPEQMKQGSAIELSQFDPNFFSPNQVHCRFPDCHERKVRNQNASSKMDKEDLYLCLRHRCEMVDLVTKKCAEKDITVNFKEFENVDLKGYTSLIGVMEKLFQHFVEKVPSSSSAQLDRSLAEIFLNIRNFFIITNAVLNPNPENRGNVVPPVYFILNLLLERLNNREFVDNIRVLLRDIVQIIFTPFRVIYNWVHVVVLENPGAKIGAGVGAAGGAIVMSGEFGSNLPMFAFGVGLGLLSGGLIGGGLYDLFCTHFRENPGAEIGVGLGAVGGAIVMRGEFGSNLPMLAFGVGLGLLSGGLIGGGLYRLYHCNNANNHQKYNTFHYQARSNGKLTMTIVNYRRIK